MPAMLSNDVKTNLAYSVPAVLCTVHNFAYFCIIFQNCWNILKQFFIFYAKFSLFVNIFGPF